MRAKDFKNILIIGHSNIGDVCYDLAVIAPLHKAYPGARISFLTSSRGRELAEGYPGITRIITYDKHTRDKGIKGRLELLKTLRKERFDLALILKTSLFFLFLGVARAWTLKKRFFKDSSGKDVHRADVYLNILRSGEIPVEGGAEFNFNISAKERVFADSFFKKEGVSASDNIVAILPFTNWSLKCWPIEKWNELIEILVKSYGMKVIMLGKDSDDSYSKEVTRRISSFALSAINKCSLKESMAIIGKSKVFISSESSLLHIASCMNVPSIGLYGPTSPLRYYPYFHRQDVINISPPLKCMPCVVTGECKAAQGQAPCMQAISVEAVLGAVKRKLGL